MSIPVCPINQIGIRHSVICSDGYMYEERCIEEWIKSGKYTSPVNRMLIDFVKECDINEKCLNVCGEEIEDDYEWSNFDYSRGERIIQYYLDLIVEEEMEDVIFDRNLMMNLVVRNVRALEFACDELRNDREIVMEAVKQNGGALMFASDELRNDREIVLEAVKQNGFALVFASDELRNDREIVMEAVKNKGPIL